MRGIDKIAAAATMALALTGTAHGGDMVPTVRVGTAMGASAAVTLVAGGPFCLFGCSGSAGAVLELEGGLGGAKAGVGLGIGERSDEDIALATIKAVVLRSWASGVVGPGDATYAGPEIDFVSGRGLTVGLLKRVDGSGWRISLGFVQAF